MASILGCAALFSIAACGDDGASNPDARRFDGGVDVDASFVNDASMLDAEPAFDASPPVPDATPPVPDATPPNPDATPNTPPTITDIADQSTQFPAVGPLSFTVGDAETALSSLIITATSNNQTVVPDANLLLAGADADRMITVTPAASGTATITVTVDDGTDTASDVFDVMVTNSGPVGVADDYDWFGNTELVVADTAGVVANDTDADIDTLTAVAVVAGATTLGGSYDLATDGSFVYRPPLGLTGVTDTFMYTVTDGFETGMAVASIALTEMVWYVDNSSAAGGDGRSFSPFDTLAEAATASAVDEVIYVFEGDGTTLGQSNGISLKDGQRLIGQGADLVLGSTTVRFAGNDPVITNTAGAGVLLNGTTTVEGLTIDAPTTDGINGNAITGATIRGVTIIAANDQSIDLGNTGPAGTVTVVIRNNTLRGNGTDFLTTTIGIDVQVGGANGGNLDAQIRDNIISDVEIGILVFVNGTTGNGGGGPNMVTIDNNSIVELDDDAIQLEPDDTANSAFFVTNNTIDGVQNFGTPLIGLDFRCRTTPGGITKLTVTGNTVDDMGLEGLNIVGSGAGNGGTVTVLIDNNTITGSGNDGIAMAPDDAMTINATVSNNTMIGNGARSTFEFFTGTLNVLTLNLNLIDNEDDQGFTLERDLNGILNLGGTIGQGMSFNDDNGNVANNGNTTGGLAPSVNIAGTAKQINIIDASTIPLP